MKIRKYICIRYHHLTQKSCKEYYLKEAENAGLDVEYWDTTYLFFDDDYGQEDSSYLIKTRKFKKFFELESAIKEQNISSVIFVTTSSFEYRVKKLHTLFTQYKCLVAGFGRNMYPISTGLSISRFKGLTPHKIINYLLNRCLTNEVQRRKIKTFDVVFLAGENGWQALGRINKDIVQQIENIQINSCDYDNCMEDQSNERLLPYDYILFLDQYLPLHPDMQMLGEENVSVEKYYKEINRYFSKIEKQLKLPIVIAAHPKAILYKKENYFDGRIVLFDQTQQLSKYATLVLAHNSVSINYPIIYNTPLHFITSSEIEKHVLSVHLDVQLFAQTLGTNWEYFDIDKATNISFQANQQQYNNYKYLYQTSLASEHIMTKEIFIDFLLHVNYKDYFANK